MKKLTLFLTFLLIAACGEEEIRPCLGVISLDGAGEAVCYYDQVLKRVECVEEERYAENPNLYCR